MISNQLPGETKNIKTKGTIYASIMLLVPFVISMFIYEVNSTPVETFQLSLISSAYLNAQLFVLGAIIEGIKYVMGKYKNTNKKFWFELIETTFALWILSVIMIGLVQIYLRF